MAYVSKLKDSNGNSYDLAAKKLAGTARSIELTSDVTGSTTSTFEDGSTVSITTTISDNAVTNSKIANSAVTTSKIDDLAVESSKIANGAVTNNKIGAAAVSTDKINDGAVTFAKMSSGAVDTTPTYGQNQKLITSGAVYDAISGKQDSISFDGTYNATTNKAATQSTVTNAINALDATVNSTGGTNIVVQAVETNGVLTGLSVTTDNTENKNNKVTTWSATTSDSKYPSEKLVKTSLDAKAESSDVYTKTQSDNKYKTKQSAKSNPSTSGTEIAFIDSVAQNANGEITATRKTVRSATTSQTGVVQLKGSIAASETDDSKAATPKAVADAISAAIGGSGVVNNVSYTDGKLQQTKGSTTTDVVDLDSTFRKVSDSYTKTEVDTKLEDYVLESDVQDTYDSTSDDPISGVGVANAFEQVGLRDIVCGVGTASGNTWFKIAERTIITDAYNTANFCGDLSEALSDSCVKGTFSGAFRIMIPLSDSSVRSSKTFLDRYSSVGDIVTNFNLDESTNTFTQEIWVRLGGQNRSITISNLKILGYSGIRKESEWTIHYNPTGTTTAPTAGNLGLVDSTKCNKASAPSGTSVGSSSVPVYVNLYGDITACSTASLKAGKDGSGNTITSTYETITNVLNKNNLRGTLLTSSDDLNNYSGYKGELSVYYFASNSRPSNAPGTVGSGIVYVFNPTTSSYYTRQVCIRPDTYGDVYIRYKRNSTWDATWEHVYIAPKKSSEASGLATDDTRFYTGKAIAEYVANAIGGNVGGYMGECSKADIYTSTSVYHDFKLGDWFVASEAGTYTYRVEGANYTIDNVTIGAEIYYTTDKTLEVKPTTAYELTANKVTTIDSSDTHYPSSNAVKTYTDTAISNLSSVYETITNVANKSNLKMESIGSTSVDLDTVVGTSGTVNWYCWSSASHSNILNKPEGTASALQVISELVTQNVTQICYPRRTNASNNTYYWVRKRYSDGSQSIWTDWMKVYYEATSTYSATGTQAVNGTAVASALSSYVAESSVQDTYNSTSEDPISGKGVDDAFEKTGLAEVRFGLSSTSGGYYKIAEKTTTATYQTNAFSMDVTVLGSSLSYSGKLVGVFRSQGPDSATRNTVERFLFELDSETSIVEFIANGNYDTETRATKWELWARLTGTYRGCLLKNIKFNSYSSTPSIGWTIYRLPTWVPGSTGITPGNLGLVTAEKRVYTSVKSGTAIGSSSVPMYASSSGVLTACTTENLMAGKDGSGNQITTTYATKTEVNNKTWNATYNSVDESLTFTNLVFN